MSGVGSSGGTGAVAEKTQRRAARPCTPASKPPGGAGRIFLGGRNHGMRLAPLAGTLYSIRGGGIFASALGSRSGAAGVCSIAGGGAKSGGTLGLTGGVGVASA